MKINTIYSKYSSIDDIEEHLPVMKARQEAKIFYLDKTKDLDNRIKAFNMYGEYETDIAYHKNVNLLFKHMFKVYLENYDRYRTCITVDIIENWLEILIYKRSIYNFSTRELEQSERNYKPSQEAIDRLWEYYIEKLFETDKVSKFTHDW